MSHSLNVRVLDRNGDPVKGVRVRIIIAGWFSGGALEAFTSEDGHAELNPTGDYQDSRELKIYVRGQSFGPYDIGGGAYTVQVD